MTKSKIFSSKSSVELILVLVTFCCFYVILCEGAPRQGVRIPHRGRWNPRTQVRRRRCTSTFRSIQRGIGQDPTKCFQLFTSDGYERFNRNCRYLSRLTTVKCQGIVRRISLGKMQLG
ncbi:unnamed protein product [Clavelina lepadiformis]|uniref:Secreted protein n=1 Tax=Clavelina lepadiformis TaxID=159417 RepID=A0ABP0F4L7_CLALP